MTPFHVIEM